MTLSKLFAAVAALAFAGTTLAVELPGAGATTRARVRAVAPTQAVEKADRTVAQKRNRILANSAPRATAAS